jgi:hypothetical protein
MRRVSGVGVNTGVYCANRSSVTAPAGESFSSGAPDIRVPENSIGIFKLVAK